MTTVTANLQGQQNDPLRFQDQLNCERRKLESLSRFHAWKTVFGALTCFLLAAVATLAQSTISVNVSPQRGGLTIGQTLSVTATVANDSQNKGVTWSATGGSFSLTASASGAASTYTAPSTAGVYVITATSVADVTKSASITVGVTDLAGVYTYHNNLSRDGSNPSEHALTTSNVTTATFGKLFSCTVDGAIYAQPLWVANLTIGSVKRNIVFVATQHESLYAFDADANTSPCTPLWHVSLTDATHGGSSSETSVPAGTSGNLVGSGDGDISPEVGVTGTPVIDPSTNTIYLVSKSVIISGPTFYQRLHGIDITTGSEKFGGPVTIGGTYPGTRDGGATDAFNARQQNQRPGLALVNGIVYIAWASHEDNAPYYGWVMGYKASNLTQTAVLNVTPNVGYGGIWMGGGAPAADASNNLYLITGNATFDATNSTAPNNDYGDSFLKLTSGLTVSQYFTPTDQANDNSSDRDFGSGGAAIMVDQPTGPVPRMVIGGGKDGFLYVLNRDAMGGLGDGNAWQRFNFGNEIFATAAFWNNTLYLAGVGGHLQAFSFNTSTGMFNTPNASQSSATYGFPGSTPSVSSSGATNGIVWALDDGNYCTNQSGGCSPAVLHAYDGTNLVTELWNSTLGTGNSAGNAVKFSVPTVANGKVYVGTRGNNTGGVTSSSTIPGELDVYGLLNKATQVAIPTFSPAGGTYSSGQSITISDTTGGATIYYTTNGATPTTSSTVYTGPVSVSATETIEAIAVASGLSQSAVASSTYTIVSQGTPPTLSSVTPNSGMQGQSNLSVVLTGANFLAAPVCNFGSGIIVNSCIYNSATQIAANISIAANATVGTNTISITDTDGQIATLAAGFSISANTNPFSPILVNAGGPAYSDSQAQTWSADKNFSGGTPASTTHNIANTPDPTLYQTERYGNFTYQFTVPNGGYNVTLKFAEIYWDSAGKRIFNVAINGTPVLANFDIFAAVGGQYTAIDKTFAVTTSTGAITIQFTSGSADLPKISAIEISSAGGLSVQVSPTTASLHASQQQQFVASVAGNTNTAVTWTCSPQIGTLTANGLYTAPPTVSTPQTVSVTATSQADTTKSAVAIVTLLPPAGSFTPIFVHSGGGSYTDSLGNTWSADADFTGGQVSSTTTAIANTPDPALYQTDRYGNSTYTFAVPPGNYSVILKFAETYWTSTGKRLFNTSINGTQVLTNFDIVAAAGAAFTAIDESFPVTVTGNSIVIQFTTGSVNLPKICAIEIKAASGVAIHVTPTTASLLASQSQQFAATVTGTSNPGVTWTYTPSIGTLVTSGATAGLYTAPGSITSAQSVKVTATSIADPTQSSTATVSLVPQFSPILVHSGGAAYTDTLGQTWSADTGFIGGNSASTSANIANTADPKLYQTERYGDFSYQFKVPNGSYNVVLKFAEIYWTQTGQRIFNVSINGTQVLTNFDIVAAAGTALTAIDKTFPVTSTNGLVTIQFTSGTANLPKVSAVEIH
jgi:Malectin domain/Chitobiase/beta-hexosaminidase C-terminal domain